jgi:hypothetical protein
LPSLMLSSSSSSRMPPPPPPPRAHRRPPSPSSHTPRGVARTRIRVSPASEGAGTRVRRDERGHRRAAPPVRGGRA